jgi:adenylate cyclase
MFLVPYLRRDKTWIPVFTGMTILRPYDSDAYGRPHPNVTKNTLPRVGRPFRKVFSSPQGEGFPPSQKGKLTTKPKIFKRDFMTTQEVKRKLTAILSADVKGYSRLMGEDEEWTLRTLNTYKEVMRSLIQQYRGRVVNAPGDNVLAEFASVVDAVQCAVEIQQVLRARNALLPENRRMEFRIGINLGDVIEEGDSIYGDGVNIAARLEGLAEAGGICISESAYQQIENKLPLKYEYLGEHEVKNIAKPVRVYRAQIESEEPSHAKVKTKVESKNRKYLIIAATVVVVIAAAALWQFVWRPSHRAVEIADPKKMAFPLPDKPSIAVLPFANMSDDPKQEYFSDGITEEIITALSKTPRIFVIARNSTFTYKGKAVRVRQVAEELGVRYVLEGSVRKSENHVRVTAQLIDALTGKHLWAERYDRDLKELFAIQDEITLEIIRALQVNLTEGEQARVIGKGTKNLQAYLKALEAIVQFSRMDKQGSMKAKQLAKEAIALDPNYAYPYSTLSSAHLLDLWFDFSESPKESMRLAVEAAQKALALDPSDPRTHLGWVNLYIMQREYDKAIASAERAVALNPGGARPLAALATAMNYSCRFNETVTLMEQAIRLDPFPSSIGLRNLGITYRNVGRYGESVKQLKKALELSPNDLFAHLSLAITYIKLGRDVEAKAEAAEVLRIHPKFSLDYYARVNPLKCQSVLDDNIACLRKAGLK